MAPDGNVTDATDNEEDSGKFNTIKIIIIIIACVGVITNIVVVIVFLNDRKLRRKIPNICIINQVCIFLHHFYIFKIKEITNRSLLAQIQFQFSVHQGT